MAGPIVCDGSSYLGLKGYVVVFSDSNEGKVQLQVVRGEKDLILERVKVKRDYQDSYILNFHGLGAREIDLSGYVNTATGSGIILLENQEIKLKDCQ